MKGCPTCKGTYTESVAFCPRDGTPLVETSHWTEGQVIRGKYRLLGNIGVGGMGTVYKALHLRFDELRAIKVINQELVRDEIFVKRFMQEAVLARKLHHSNAVGVDDIDEAEDGRPFIIMEYIEGPSLKNLAEAQGALLLERVCSIAKQVASALDAAHRLGMVHRDIKPANIVLVQSAQGEQAKVLDFGIAKLKESRADVTAGFTLTGTGMVIGTPQYMSPEQALGKRGDELDGRSDLYSLGVVMYQMLTGNLPFKSDTTMQMLMDHIHTPPKPIQQARPDLQIPDCVARVVMRCLEKKPELRPPSAQALIQEIESAEAEVAAARLEKERLAREQAEAGIATARAEQERLQKAKLEQERLAREQAEAEVARARAEQERLLKAQLDQEKRAQERAEAERRASEKAEKERLARVKAEEERQARDAEKQRQRELEKAWAERRAAERTETKRLAQARKEEERLARQSAAAVQQDSQTEIVSVRPLWRRQGALAISTLVVAIILGTGVWRFLRSGSHRELPRTGPAHTGVNIPPDTTGSLTVTTPNPPFPPKPDDLDQETAKAITQGDSYVEQGDYARAIEAYQAGEKAMPDNKLLGDKIARAQSAQTAEQVGARYLSQGDYPDSIRQFELARRLEPGNKSLADKLMRAHSAQAAVQMGVNYMNQGDYVKAISAFKRGLRLEPNDASLKGMLARAESARAAEAKYGIPQD